MKAIILAGGYGLRLSEETAVKPKPMVEIGGKPIIWHIMKIYSNFGINEFIICLGYKGYVIKEYFSNYFLHNSDVTFDFSLNETTIHNSRSEAWKVTLIDTGKDTMTGGRLKQSQPYVGNETFCFTYGDGVSNVDINKLIECHKEGVSNGYLATLTAVMPKSRYGTLELDGNKITRFIEKPENEKHFINGGFFVLEPEIFDYIEGASTTWEKEPLERLSLEEKLQGYKHSGFWHPMDTQRDKNILDDFWANNDAPWKVWND